MVGRDFHFQRAEALPVYPFLAADEVKRTVVARGADVIDLGLGNPDLGTPPSIVDELHRAADVPSNHRYHPGQGAIELREAFSRWYRRRYEAPFDPEREIVVTIGAKEAISHLCLTVLSPGDTAIVPDPCYPIHEGGPLIAGAKLERYPIGATGGPAGAVAEALARVRGRGDHAKLVIANYPHNPTGTVATRNELGALVRVVRDSGALLLHDLAYADLDYGARHAPSIFDVGVPHAEVREFAVEVFSMSKSYNMPGWRVGLMAGNTPMVTALTHVKSYLDYGNFRPLQLAAAWALDHGDRLTDEIRERYRGRALALCQALSRAGWLEGREIEPPGGTMFSWVPVPSAYRGQSSLEVTRRLLEEAEVAVAPGSGFGAHGEGFLRLSLIADEARLAEAGERIARALAG